MTPPLRVLVANRGEIALRIVRTLRTLGIPSIAVFSELDAGAPHVRAADQAIAIGPAPPAESYLSIERVLDAGRKGGANAVHPGYGFLSENPRFAEAVENEGWIFIGPAPETIRTMGEKSEARRTAEAAGIPVVPAFTPAEKDSKKDFRREAKRLGFPVMLKAAAGGGGKGMRVVSGPDELDAAVVAARREAETAFGDGRIFVERFIASARHVEVQVLGDGRGHGVALGERDCSIQRRHQKLIEETPAPRLTPRLRERMHEAAVTLVKKSRYRGAGTVEFIVSTEAEFYFLEMNTRLQVEHPVTEMVHGVDLVAHQIAIAAGEGLSINLAECEARGHAIEVRVYAENPALGFLPSTGRLRAAIWPTGPGIRVDAGVETGSEVSIHYDPLLAKVIAHAPTREQALERLRGALADTFLAGVETTTAFCRDLIDAEAFRHGDLHTGFIPENFPTWNAPPGEDVWQQAAACAARGLASRSAPIGTDGTRLAPLFESLDRWRMIS